MLMKMASTIVRFLEKQRVADPALRDVYLYGCEAALYTLSSTVGLLLLGITLNHLWETALLVCVFYINQSIGGGFHASTHLSCFITMAIGVVCFIAALHLHISGWTALLVGGISIAILFTIPLVLHTNKQYLAYKAAQFVKRSRIATCIQGVALILIYYIPLPWVLRALAIALMLCALSRCAGLWRGTRIL